MNFRIHELVLYSKRQGLVPRTLTFVPDRVNVITGTSKRGKSAVGKIIDYCLASSSCQIPKGNIRNAVSWFGIGVALKTEYLFIARRSPGDDDASQDCYVESHDGPFIPLPGAVEKNITADRLKQLLDTKAQLAKIPVEAFPAARERFGGAPGFRDFVGLSFLPQHIVANPQTLFYRTDNYVYSERLKRVFPLALGAVSQESLLAEMQMHELQREITSLAGQLDSRKEALDTWQHEAAVFFGEAVNLGIVPDDVMADEQQIRTTAAYLDAIGRVLSSYDDGRRPSLVGMAERYAKHLAATQSHMQRLEQRRHALRRRLLRASNLQHVALDFQETLRLQKDSVSVAEKMQDMVRSQTCPLCGTHTDTVSEGVKALAHVSSDLAAQAEQSESASKSYLLDVEKETEEKLRECERSIFKIQTYLTRLARSSQEVRAYQDTDKAAARLVGKIEQLLDLASTSQTMTDLAAQRSQLEERVAELKQKYDFTKKAERVRKAIEGVSTAMVGHAETLDLEWSDARPSIDLTHLTVRFAIGDDAKKHTFLSELGSGENWMGYHIAAFLSLHELFSLRGENCPVPSVLIIDQPTQVYFPAQINAYEQIGRAHV